MRSVTGDSDKAAQNFTYFSSLDYDKVENYLLSFSNEKTADEFAVIAVKDPADVQDAAVSLSEHKDSRCNNWIWQKRASSLPRTSMPYSSSQKIPIPSGMPLSSSWAKGFPFLQPTNFQFY